MDFLLFEEFQFNNQKAGITSLTARQITTCLPEYIRILRHEYFLSILMERESNDRLDGPGWYGRYYLKTNMTEVIEDTKTIA